MRHSTPPCRCPGTPLATSELRFGWPRPPGPWRADVLNRREGLTPLTGPPPRGTHPLALLSVAVSLVAAAAFVWASWRNGETGHPEVRPDRWHHLYLGLGLSALGAWRRSAPLLALGAIIAGDDAWQHVRHVTGTPDYVSPLRAAFTRYLWPHALVRWLTGWLDALFS